MTEEQAKAIIAAAQSQLPTSYTGKAALLKAIQFMANNRLKQQV